MVKSKSCDFMGDGLESSLAVKSLLDSTCSDEQDWKQMLPCPCLKTCVLAMSSDSPIYLFLSIL